MVNKAGTSFDHRMLEETGAPVPDITRAHVAARDVFGMRALWDEIGTLDGKVPSDVQLRLWLNLRQVVERGVLWLLRHRRPPLEIGATVTAFQAGVAELMDNLPEAVVGAKAKEVAARRATFVDAGVPVELAHRAAAWPLLHTAFDIIEVAHARGRPVGGGRRGVLEAVRRARPELALGSHRAAARAPIAGRPMPGPACATTCWRPCASCSTRCCAAVTCSPASRSWSKEWTAFNDRPVERVARAFGEIRSGGTFDLTTLSVAQRQLRNLVLTSSPCR